MTWQTSWMMQRHSWRCHDVPSHMKMPASWMTQRQPHDVKMTNKKTKYPDISKTISDIKIWAPLGHFPCPSDHQNVHTKFGGNLFITELPR